MLPSGNLSRLTPRTITFLDSSYVKKRSILASVLYGSIGLLGILLCVIPLAKIGNAPIGNGFSMLIDSIKLLLGKSEELSESSRELQGFLLPLVAFLGLFILNSLMGAIVFPFSTKKDNCEAGLNQWVFLIGKTIIAIVYLIYVTWLSNYYALSSVVLYAFPLCIIPSAGILLSDVLHLRKCASADGESSLYRVERMLDKPWIDAIECVVIPVVLLACLLMPVKYNILTRYSTLPTAKVGAEELRPFVGRWASAINISNEQGLSISVSTDNTTPWTEIGTNHRYYNSKISDLRKEMNALFPEEGSKEGLEAYAAKLKKIEQDIQEIEEARTYLPINKTTVLTESIAVNSLKFVRIKSISYNANSTFRNEIGHKWGVSGDTVGNTLFCRESIILERIDDKAYETTHEYGFTFEDNLPFTTETDFTTALIRATVTYSDGSYRISLICPSNALDLNNAPAGLHTLRFTDDWGSYETTIQIQSVTP